MATKYFNKLPGLILGLFLLSGCGGGPELTSAPRPSSTPQIDACALAPKNEVEAIFGSQATNDPKSATRSNRITCAYMFPKGSLEIGVLTYGNLPAAQQSFAADKTALDKKGPTEAVTDLTGVSAFFDKDANLYLLKDQVEVRISLKQEGNIAIKNTVKSIATKLIPRPH